MINRLGKVFDRIACMPRANFVVCSTWPIRHGEDVASTKPQDARNFAVSAIRVRHMFKHVAGQNKIERGIVERQSFKVFVPNAVHDGAGRMCDAAIFGTGISRPLGERGMERSMCFSIVNLAASARRQSTMQRQMQDLAQRQRHLALPVRGAAPLARAGLPQIVAEIGEARPACTANRAGADHRLASQCPLLRGHTARKAFGAVAKSHQKVA
jgi:hypothetical protein